MLSREEVAAYIDAVGLSDYAEQLLNLLRPTIRVKRQKVREEAEIPLGRCKAGGAPDLPPGTEWPCWHAMPLTFMMQLRLSDVAPFDLEHLLPPQGMLYFFYDMVGLPSGYDPAHRGGWRVLFTDSESGPLGRTPHPVAPGERGGVRSLSACQVTFSNALSLPTDLHSDFKLLGLKDEYLERYWNLCSYLDKSLVAPAHHLLGYSVWPYDMQLECQLASHGLELGRAQSFKDPRRVELAPGARDWQFLLQIAGTDADLGVSRGDCDILYWIQAPALRARNFDNCWLVMPCS